MTFWSILRQRCWGAGARGGGRLRDYVYYLASDPGDPARLLAGDRASDAIVENIRQQLGLDQPLYVQFYRYVSDLFHGDLGTSIRTGRPGAGRVAYIFSRRRWSWLLVPCCWHS